MTIPRLRDEIETTARNLGIGISMLDGRAARAVLDCLLEKYGEDTRFEINTNNIKRQEYAAVQHPDSWMWISEFLTDEPALFFYDSRLPDDDAVFRIPSGRDIIRILNDSYAFVFYITNESYDYLLAQNDHDYIIGAGTAKPWVQSLEPRHDEWAKTLTKGAENPDGER